MDEKATPEARTFFVDTRFQRMARSPGGVPREKAIEHAQAQIEELKPEFSDWLEHELETLRAAIRHAEKELGDASRLDEAYRSCCRLRDAGTTMGFELVTFIANNLCEVLEAVKGGKAYDKDVVDCHVDALVLVRTAPYRNLRPEQLPEMTSGLRRVVELANSPPLEPAK